MQRFFVEFDDGDQVGPDEEGLDFPDVEAARRELIAALPAIAQEKFETGREGELVATLKDGQGLPILRAAVSVRTEWLCPG